MTPPVDAGGKWKGGVGWKTKGGNYVDFLFPRCL